MGYTHYWKIPSTDEWLKTWPQLVSDAKLIVKSCKIKLAGPDDEGEGHPQINETRTAFNGGNGNGHQPFILKSKATKFSCCKTAHKPYDLVVAAILLRASQLAGDAIRIR
ncbi:hypothetical protein HII31_05416 [Pseudocercospora fuligena]|uniref:Uncharacterized protein n=1 Tax=Pseudocercospora fuligena TaxID=685502 RepID=A0A8H6VNI6_9PEZI|nr:hypothetical protein HII31_05416 [Pseudocercospora fuligena]